MLQKGEPYFTTCNILCVSNLIAAVTSWPMFWQDLKWKKVRALRARDWAAILVASLARNVGGAYLEVAGLSMTKCVRVLGAAVSCFVGRGASRCASGCGVIPRSAPRRT